MCQYGLNASRTQRIAQPHDKTKERRFLFMSNPFFDHPILNSPYQRPSRHWELDETGQPTQKIVEDRRKAQFITPIPKPKKQKTTPKQGGFLFDEGKGLSTGKQQYDPTSRDQTNAAVPSPILHDVRHK